MSNPVLIEPLTAEAFAPFGDILQATGEPDSLINGGRCARYNNLAKLDFEATGRAGISLFLGQPYTLPHELTLVERHPRGSQAFVPMSGTPYLVVVATDEDGRPGRPRAFIAAPQQGVNIHRNVWHGVLTPLDKAAHFAVVDWIGEGVNLEEYHFETPIMVQKP